jgi:mono/diheme cytochrome c family protein/rhodanese-related sulfurtransferase
MTRTTIVALNLLLAAVLAACREAPVASPPSEDQRIELGEALYVRYCKLCHGEDGAGYAADHAAQLGNPLFVASATRDQIWFGIKYGRPGTAMAAFGTSQGGPLEDEQIKNVVRYIKSLKYYQRDAPAPAGDSGRGTALYATHCAACHGPHGEGRTGPSLGSPYFLISATDSFLTYAIKYGRPSTPMKSFAAELSEQQIADLVALIRSWARNVDDGPVQGEPLPPLSSLVINPGGPIAKLTPTAGHYVPAEQVSTELKAGARMVILDARVTSDWMSSHIPGAYPAPFYDALPPDLLGALPRSGTPIVIYCGCPHAASDEVAALLDKAGFTNVVVLEEGILVWGQRGYPLTFGKRGSNSASR